jgi:hypothetical protein
MARWNFWKNGSDDALYDVPITGEEHSLARYAKLAFDQGIDPSGMSLKEIEDVLYPEPNEPIEYVPFEPTPAKDLLAKVLGRETAELATEAEAIELLQVAVALKPIAEDEIQEFLDSLPTSWPTEPRVGELVNAIEFGRERVADGILHTSGGFAVTCAVWVEQTTLLGDYNNGGNIKVERPFDAIPVPVKEETVGIINLSEYDEHCGLDYRVVSVFEIQANSPIVAGLDDGWTFHGRDENEAEYDLSPVLRKYKMTKLEKGNCERKHHQVPTLWGVGS